MSEKQREQHKKEQRKRKRYLTGPQVRERYGDKSNMWLWRKRKFDPNFPRPVVHDARMYFDEDELDHYDEAARSEAPDAASGAAPDAA